MEQGTASGWPLHMLHVQKHRGLSLCKYLCTASGASQRGFRTAATDGCVRAAALSSANRDRFRSPTCRKTERGPPDRRQTEARVSSPQQHTLATQGVLMRMFGERRSRWMMGGECACNAAMPLAVPHSCSAGGNQGWNQGNGRAWE